MYSNMSDNSEMIDLYSKKILEFAGNIPLTTPLVTFSGTATRRSPMCGSNLQVWITVNGGKITNFSHEVKNMRIRTSVFSNHSRANYRIKYRSS